MGFGRGYQIFEENQHEKTMRPVRKIPPWCYFHFNITVYTDHKNLMQDALGLTSDLVYR